MDYVLEKKNGSYPSKLSLSRQKLSSGHITDEPKAAREIPNNLSLWELVLVKSIH
jgi:hypothetical protein